MPAALPPHSCGSCTLCCKVMRIPELQSPQGEWCPHCAQGVGCRIYATRPNVCRDFACLWLNDASMPDAWKPTHSKIVLFHGAPNDSIYANVDPGFPQVWRKAPYFDTFRRWARELIDQDRYVFVLVREIATLILPDEIVPVGRMRDGDPVVIHKRSIPSPLGPTYKVEVQRG